ncbi:hypothetical protein TRVL_10014 [Trypanosoma vivax]|nr:hypothetical protein TRVL_10014 [Trypanosoma vivax]
MVLPAQLLQMVERRMDAVDCMKFSKKLKRTKCTSVDENNLKMMYQRVLNKFVADNCTIALNHVTRTGCRSNETVPEMLEQPNKTPTQLVEIERALVGNNRQSLLCER